MASNRRALRFKARRSTDGQPCEAYATAGSLVCSAHGGRAPQLKTRARERELDRQAERRPAVTAALQLVGAEHPVTVGADVVEDAGGVALVARAPGALGDLAYDPPPLDVPNLGKVL
jgi:hypothetical protein